MPSAALLFFLVLVTFGHGEKEKPRCLLTRIDQRLRHSVLEYSRRALRRRSRCSTFAIQFTLRGRTEDLPSFPGCSIPDQGMLYSDCVPDPFQNVQYPHCLELSEEIKEIIQHVHNECVGKTGVAEEDIVNCENGIFKEDMKLKCYMFCLLEGGSLVDDDGNVDYDMMVSLIPEQYTNRVVNMIDGCKHLDTPDKDKCQRAYDVHKCSYSKDPKFYFLF